MTEFSHKLEDYIEAIYVLREQNKLPVRIKELSSFLKVNKTTAVAAVKKLKESEMAIQEHYGYILLTQKGEAAAQAVYAKHFIIKEFLMKSLGVSESSAEQDACSMEHFLSAETIQKIKDLMKKGNG